MRPRHLDVWKPTFERDFGQFAREMGRVGGEMARFGRDFRQMQRRAYARRAARRNRWAAGPWRSHSWDPSPWPLGLGLCGLASVGTWKRRRAALRYRSYYRRRRFWRTVQVLLGLALVALVIAIMSRQDDGSPNNSNWL